MAQVMQVHVWECGQFQEFFEPSFDIPGIKRSSLRCRENEPGLNPPASCCGTFQPLARLMCLERSGHRRRHSERSPALCRLRLDQLQRVAHALESLLHAQCAGGEINDLPAKSERFTLAQSERNRNGVQRF